MEEQEKLAPLMAKQQVRQNILQKETQRALRAAAAYRQKVADGLVTNRDIPSHPVGKYIPKNGIGYDETCYHRDFVAVKTKNETDIKGKDAWEAATEAEQKTLYLLERKAQNAQKLQQLMLEKQKRAMQGLVMDQASISIFF